ncbi:MAG: DNA-binding protein [Saccharofermentans sp.]|nr:DNA-binding protein [Mageeibacillus sp.]MCI1263591.1 DNA-binding protein [Saccharofermentans sp.]MCI1274471.1 DNA-binding protein [Saccharofermentans sp.]
MGVSEQRVTRYCPAIRIPGPTRFRRAWAITADSKKPADPRKNEKEVDPPY